MTDWIITESSDMRIEVVDELGSFQVSLSLDEYGCTHLYHYYNGSTPSDIITEDDVDYLHVCDLDELIADLQAIKALGEAYRRGEAEVGCPHTYKSGFQDGREQCQACGEKFGDWPEPEPPSALEIVTGDAMTKAYNEAVDAMIFGTGPGNITGLAGWRG